MQNEKEYKAKEVKPYTKEEVDKILTDIDLPYHIHGRLHTS